MAAIKEAKQKSGAACLSCGGTDTEFWTVAQDREYFTSQEDFTYLHCCRCDCLFIDPVPRNRLDEIYPANYYSFDDDNLGFAGRIKDWLDQRSFQSITEKLPGSELRVLDVGGGGGRQLDILRKVDPRITESWLVDIDPDACRRAEAKGHRTWSGRFEDFNTDHSFDLILLLNIIEHVDDPLAFLKKVRSILGSSGVAVIKTPNWRSLDETLFRRHSWSGYHCPRHWVLWNRDSFGDLVARAKLKTHKAWYTQGAVFWASSLLSLLAGRGLIRIGRDRPVVYHPLFPLVSAGFAIFDFVRAPFSTLSQMFFVVRR